MADHTKSYIHDPTKNLWDQQDRKGSKQFSITFTNNETVVYSWLRSHVVQRGTKVVGLDAEWLGDMTCVGRPGAKGETFASYLQLSVSDAALVVYVRDMVRAHGTADASQCLQKLFNAQSPFQKYTFVGAGGSHDKGMIRNALPGCLGLYEEVDVLKGRGQIGLEALTLSLLPETARWKKGQSNWAYSRSDWSSITLSDEHIRYAAMDAWAALWCFHKLNPDVPLVEAAPVKSTRIVVPQPAQTAVSMDVILSRMGSMNISHSGAAAMPAARGRAPAAPVTFQATTHRRGRSSSRARARSRPRGRSLSRMTRATVTSDAAHDPLPLIQLIQELQDLVLECGGALPRDAVSFAFPRWQRPNGYTKLSKLVAASGLERVDCAGTWFACSRYCGDVPSLTVPELHTAVRLVFRRVFESGGGEDDSAWVSLARLGAIFPKAWRPVGYKKNLLKLAHAVDMDVLEDRSPMLARPAELQ